MTTDTTNPEGRNSKGQFKPGFGGRKPGSKNKASKATLTAVQSLAGEAVAALREQMRQGNMRAVQLILEYTLPRGGRTIDLDGSANPNDLISAFTTGEISGDEFARASQAWKSASDAADMADIKQQIQEVEALVASLKK